LQEKVRQARIDQIIDRESKEKSFEPLIEQLDKVVKAVKKTDEDLSRRLELVPAEQAAEVIAPPTPIKKLTYKPPTMIGAIPRLYLPFPDDKFGIWTDRKSHYVGDTPVVIDDNDLIIKNKRYTGTHGLWMLLTNPDKKSLDKDTFKAWWTNLDNFTEEDYDTYKEILNVTNAVYQNNDPSSDKPKSSGGKKWNDLISPIWREFKSAKKSGSGLIKYHEGPVEYKYIDNLNELQQRVYFLMAEEHAGNNNFHNEKLGIINFIDKQLKANYQGRKGIEYLIRISNNLPKVFYNKNINNLIHLQRRLYSIHTKEQAGNNKLDKAKLEFINFVTNQLKKYIDKPKGIEYILRILNSLPKGVYKNGSGIFNTLLNKLSNVMPELHIPGYKFCGSFTKLDKRLARGDEPINKMDEGCKEHDIFYRDHEDTKERHVADKKLEDVAKERILSSDASARERVEAAFIAAAMKGKRFFGMGLDGDDDDDVDKEMIFLSAHEKADATLVTAAMQSKRFFEVDPLF
jgi:hypothetical protein